MIRRELIKLLMAAVMTVGLNGCGGDNDSATSSGFVGTDPNAGGHTGNTPSLILAVGDSNGTGHNIATPWPNRVQSSTGVRVINESRMSRKTSDVVGNVPAWMDEHKPSHLMILLGTNDARGGSVSAAVTNLTNWANSARQRGITIIIGTIPPNLSDSGANARAENISAGLRGISGARIAEVRGAMGSGHGLLADGLHANDKGQSTIANAFVQQM